jgi:hypothetical protein
MKDLIFMRTNSYFLVLLIMPVFFNISGIVLAIIEVVSTCTSLVTLTSLQESKATSPSSKFVKDTEKALLLT